MTCGSAFVEQWLTTAACDFWFMQVPIWEAFSRCCTYFGRLLPRRKRNTWALHTTSVLVLLTARTYGVDQTLLHCTDAGAALPCFVHHTSPGSACQTLWPVSLWKYTWFSCKAKTQNKTKKTIQTQTVRIPVPKDLWKYWLQCIICSNLERSGNDSASWDVISTQKTKRVVKYIVKHVVQAERVRRSPLHRVSWPCWSMLALNLQFEFAAVIIIWGRTLFFHFRPENREEKPQLLCFLCPLLLRREKSHNVAVVFVTSSFIAVLFSFLFSLCGLPALLTRLLLAFSKKEAHTQTNTHTSPHTMPLSIALLYSHPVLLLLL